MGLTVKADVARDSAGFEDMEAFFSPATIASRRQTLIQNSAQHSSPRSMDVAESAIRHEVHLCTDCVGSENDPRSVVAERRKSMGPAILKRSPAKTSLNSPALRVRSVLKKTPMLSDPKRQLNSHPARRLDFSRSDPGAPSDDEDEDEESQQRRSNAKRKRTISYNKRRKSESPHAANEGTLTNRVWDTDDEPAGEPSVEEENDAPQFTENDGEVDNSYVEMVMDTAADSGGNDDDSVMHTQNNAREEGEHLSAAKPQKTQTTEANAPTPGRRPTSASKKRILPDEDQETEESGVREPSPEVKRKHKTAARRTSAPPVEVDQSLSEAPVRKSRARSSKMPETLDGDPPGKEKKPKKARTIVRDPALNHADLRPPQERVERARTRSPQREWRETVTTTGKGVSVDADGTRRSHRTKIPPLAFWRGEKVVFGRGRRRESGPGFALPEIKEIVHVDDAPEGEQTKRRVRPGVRKSRQKDVKDEEQVSEEGDESDTWADTEAITANVRTFEDPKQIKPFSEIPFAMPIMLICI